MKLICELPSVDQWRWIDTENNPADVFSRGASPTQVNKAEEWIQGPSFLLTPEETWTTVGCMPDCDIPNDSSESGCVATACANSPELDVKQGALKRLMESFSDLRRVVRVAAWFLRLRKNLRDQVVGRENNTSDSDYIGACEFDSALLALVSLAQ